MNNLTSRRRGGAKATPSLPSEPTPGQVVLLAEFRAPWKQLEKLAGQVSRLGIYRCHLPEVTVLKLLALSSWYADLLLRRAREDRDAVLELDWPEPEASPYLVMRQRARVIDIAPFLRTRNSGQ